MRRSKGGGGGGGGGKREVAIRYPNLKISLWEMEEVGGKREKARFPGSATSVHACFFPLEMFQGEGVRWRQLGGKNLFMFYTVHCSPGLGE